MSTDNEMVCENKPCETTVEAPRHEVDRYKPHYSSEYTEDAWEVRVSLPGVAKSDLSISIENAILNIEGLRKMSHPGGWKRLSGSGADRHYQLRLDVGPEVDDSKIEGQLDSGELLITLPLKEQAKKRVIPIE